MHEELAPQAMENGVSTTRVSEWIKESLRDGHCGFAAAHSGKPLAYRWMCNNYLEVLLGDVGGAYTENLVGTCRNWDLNAQFLRGNQPSGLVYL